MTSFGNRVTLLKDITDALEPDSPVRTLAVFDVTGSDDCRRIHGVLASDELIARLARAFARIMEPASRCYRPWQDEFSALIEAPIEQARTMLEAATTALRKEGATSLVTAAFGIAFLPNEADEPIEALMIADQELDVARRARERRRSLKSPPNLRLARTMPD